MRWLPGLIALTVMLCPSLAAAQEGGHHPRFHRDALLALPIPDAVVASAPRTAAAVRASAQAVRAAFSAQGRLRAEMDACLRDG